MAKLYYGDGTCDIEGSEIRLVHIQYRGAIEIDSKNDSNIIMARKQGIIISPTGVKPLNDLFDYVGEFKILSTFVVNSNSEKVPTTIHRVMDYTELLNTKSEDMTTKSEDLSSTHVSGRKVAKTILKQPYWENLHTSTHGGGLYLQDGTKYDGYFHIHLDDGSAMTGNEHTEESQDLFYKNGKPTKNPSSIPYGVIEQRKQRKIQARKSRRRR